MKVSLINYPVYLDLCQDAAAICTNAKNKAKAFAQAVAPATTAFWNTPPSPSVWKASAACCWPSSPGTALPHSAWKASAIAGQIWI